MSQAQPWCPGTLVPPVWHHRLQHAGIQVGQGPPACPGGRQGQLAKIGFPPPRALVHPLQHPLDESWRVQWKRWQPRRTVAILGPRLFPALCRYHTTAGFLFLSLIFHQFSRSLWAQLYSDAESQKFQLFPESKRDRLYHLVSPNEPQPSAAGELLHFFININCVFFLAPRRCCWDCWLALVPWCS